MVIKTVNSESSFLIKKGDTCPEFKIRIRDPKTGKPVSFQGWTVTTFLYFKSSLKNNINTSSVSTLSLLGDENFCQVKVGDIAEIRGCNSDENEFVSIASINNITKVIGITGGQKGTSLGSHLKNDEIFFYRIWQGIGSINSVFLDNADTVVNEQDFSLITYKWVAANTTHTGDYLFKLTATNNITNEVRSFPLDTNGDFRVKIID